LFPFLFILRAVVMIGEKAAELIAKDNNVKLTKLVGI